MKITKKTAKIINIIVIAMAVLLIMSNIAFSATDFYSSITPSDSSLRGCMSSIGGTILGIVQTIGMAVAVIMLIVLAIKYLYSSPNDKAEIKKYAITYVVGAVILFAASGLVGLIKNWSTNAIK